jgi:lipopolysaccharide/colanic/teichoic acid biosynthesis glycosyltransferase
VEHHYHVKQLITEKSGAKAYDFFSRYVPVESPETLVLSTTNEFNVVNHPREFHSFINLSKVNNIRYINKFFEQVNSRLKNGDVFICCSETIQARKERHRIGTIPVVKNIYFAFEFIFMRVFPKVWGLKKLYFAITRGRNRLISKAETLGRLVSCGFEIVDYQSVNGLLYVVSKKVKEPLFDMNPSYGLLYKMPRLGKHGKIIGVYKFRTMHPYAEYLQDYILKVHGYAKSGKPANDFRLTPWGKYLRRYWLDELPQLINLLKGDLKLVGVRPIGSRYAEDIPKDLLELRLSQKPGCIPPYVALNMKGSVSDVLEAERIYLHEKRRRPYTTDTRYFFKAIFNIIFKRKRSA